jgi:hypothetical protein
MTKNVKKKIKKKNDKISLAKNVHVYSINFEFFSKDKFRTINFEFFSNDKFRTINFER